MKCVHCGAELKIENGFCEKCGTEVRVVPDFNALDDYIEAALTTEKPIKPVEEDASDFTRILEPVKAEDIPKDKDSHRLKILSISIFSFVLACAIIGVIVFINITGSYSYKLKSAQKAYTQGDIDESVDLYKDCLDLVQSLETNETLGHILADDLNSTDALGYYLAAVKLGSTDAKIYSWLGLYYIDNSLTDEYLALLKLSPNEEITHYLEGLMPVTPAISLESGDYNGIRSVELTAGVNNEIYYTLDGTSPDKDNGTLYDGPIELELGSTKLVAIAYSETSDKYSTESSAEYLLSIDPPAAPVIKLPSGVYNEPVPITIYCSEEDCTIRYSWNGASPNELSPIYTKPLEMLEGENTLRVIAVNTYGMSSKVTEATYLYEVLPQ